MTEQLKYYLDGKISLVNERLNREIDGAEIPKRLKDSMLYSIQAGGKRLRPILMIASCEAFGGRASDVLSSAVALEMIHTYSLIHDDLPAMDDDNYRRGKPTNHKKFDEATAILAGDGLLSYSFELIAKDAKLMDSQKLRVIQRLAQASGPSGMVAGQLLDMQAENQDTNLMELEKIHYLKTGQLLTFAVVEGAFIGGATADQMKALEQYAYYLGLIFQVQDDILDITGNPELMGKPAGSDENNFKSTYPKLLGLEGAVRQKEVYLKQARELLKRAGIEHSILLTLTEYLSSRNH